MGWLLVLLTLTLTVWGQTSSNPLSTTASLAPPAPSAPSPNPPVTAGTVSNPGNLLPDMPQAPNRNVTLIGGIIVRLDPVRDQITLQVFGGGRTVVLFDPRTRVFRSSAAVSVRDLKPGERVYVDTVLDGTDVFARSIRIADLTTMGQTSGQIVEHEPGSRELTFRDALAPGQVTLLLDANSVTLRDGRAVSQNELVRGSLVSVDFSPDGKGHGIVRQISILAVPGATFSFSGRVAHLDMSRGLLVVVDPRDQRSWEIQCDQPLLRAKPDIYEGSDVTVTTTFDGTHYLARAIAVNRSPK
jgi:hypothetical protein